MTFHSASTANFQKVNNPDLDALLKMAGTSTTWMMKKIGTSVTMRERARRRFMSVPCRRIVVTP